MQHKKLLLSVGFASFVYLFAWGYAGATLAYDKERAHTFLTEASKIALNEGLKTEYEYSRRGEIRTKDYFRGIYAAGINSSYTIDASIETIPLNKPGNYPVKYTVHLRDRYGQEDIREYYELLRVKDTKAPEIKFNADVVGVNKGERFDAKKQVKSVTDLVDGKLEYTVDSNVDTSKSGVYYVKVDAEDKNGKVAHKICVVVVGDKKSYTDAAVEAVKEKLGKDDYKLKNRTVKTVTDKATKEYDTAVKEVQAAEEAARQAALAAQRARAIRFSSGAAARSAAAASGGQAYQGGDGAWYVTYRGTDDMTTANADGSVSLWMDGYYIAHRYTQNGSMIASHPQYVVVDGKRYQYAGTVNDLKGSYATPHLDWIDQTGGIVFQTCNTDGATSQINRYLPVG